MSVRVDRNWYEFIMMPIRTGLPWLQPVAFLQDFIIQPGMGPDDQQAALLPTPHPRSKRPACLLPKQ